MDEKFYKAWTGYTFGKYNDELIKEQYYETKTNLI